MANETTSPDQNAGFIFGAPIEEKKSKYFSKSEPESESSSAQPSTTTPSSATPPAPPSSEDNFIYGSPQLKSSSTWGDVAKGSISGIYEGATRLPEALPKIPSMLSDEATYLMYKGLEKAGQIPSANEAFADYKLGQQQVSEEFKGTKLGQITEAAKEKIGEGVAAVKEKLPDVTSYLPYYGYEPKGKQAAIAKEGFAGGVESAAYLPFGPYGAFGRFVSGAISGAGGEYARQKFAGTEWEPAAQFLGAFTGQILGDMGVGAVKAGASAYRGFMPERVMGLTFIDTEKEITKRLNEAIENDIKNDLFRVSPQEMQEKIKSGELASVGDLVKPGSQTAELLMDIAAKVPGKRPDNIVSKTLIDLSGGQPLDYGKIKSSITDIQGAETKAVFDIARSAPNANNITIQDIGRLADDPTVNQIMKEVADKATLSTNPDYMVVAPTFTPGKPAVAAKEIETDIVDQYGNKIKRITPEVPATADQYTGGNINFWHDVKLGLGKKYRETGDPKYLDAQNDLIKSIRAKVPEYGTALDKSAAEYAKIDAITDGYEFMKKNLNKEDINDYLKSFEKMTDEQKQLVRTGQLANLMEIVSEGTGPASLFSQILAPQSKLNQKLAATFEKPEYDKLVGSIVQQNLENRVAKASDNLAKKVLTSGGLRVGGGGGGAVGALAGFFAGGSMMTPAGALAAVGAVLGVSRELALNSLEKKIAPTALEMLRDPEGAAKLANLIQNRPEARSFLQKMSTGLMRAAIAGERSKELSEPAEPEPLQSYGMPSPNAHGGRIAYKSGGRVKNARAVAEALMREIDQTRKMIGKKTEDILSMPDDAVATALKIARGNV